MLTLGFNVRDAEVTIHTLPLMYKFYFSYGRTSLVAWAVLCRCYLWQTGFHIKVIISTLFVTPLSLFTFKDLMLLAVSVFILRTLRLYLTYFKDMRDKPF